MTDESYENFRLAHYNEFRDIEGETRVGRVKTVEQAVHAMLERHPHVYAAAGSSLLLFHHLSRHLDGLI